MIVAKTVIDKQFWILQENDRKIGNIEACDGGYQVKINNQVAQFKTIKMAAQRVNIQFEPSKRPAKSPSPSHSVYDYPTKGKTYNGIWNVPQKLPLFTKTKKSKSWYAAGWYQVKKGRHWSVVQDPKLILLQRYSYAGPFYTKEDANEYAPTTVC
jgi:hypothetical protein